MVRHGLTFTVNDSGDSGRVFAVDRSGETVGVTSWAGDPTDVESLAPAGRHSVWVGDTGDNSGSRESIEVLKVPVGRFTREVTPAAYSLVYPDGPHDAETLLSQPRTGRLYVVTKSIFGGTVYAAPKVLSPDHPNRLHSVSGAIGIATDGSFFPDGHHYVLRDYSGATVYTFPGFKRVGSFRLPRQRQGEGIAVAPGGSVHISTEGQFSEVRTVKVPRSIRRAMEPAQAPAAAAIEPEQSSSSSPWPWLTGGAAVAGFALLGGWLLIRHGAASQDGP